MKSGSRCNWSVLWAVLLVNLPDSYNLIVPAIDISVLLKVLNMTSQEGGLLDELTQWLEGAATVIANGYWGDKLGEGILIRRERTEMERLSAYFELKGQVLKSEI